MTTIDNCGFELLDHTHRMIPTIRLPAGARREEAPCWSVLYQPASYRGLLKQARWDLFPGAADIGIRFVCVCVCVCVFFSLFSLCVFLRCFSNFYNFVRCSLTPVFCQMFFDHVFCWMFFDPVFCQMFFDPCVLSDVLWPLWSPWYNCVLSDVLWLLWSPWYNCTGWHCMTVHKTQITYWLTPVLLSYVHWPLHFVRCSLTPVFCWMCVDPCVLLKVVICWPVADCCRVLLFVDEADAFLRKRSKVSY